MNQRVCLLITQDPCVRQAEGRCRPWDGLQGSRCVLHGSEGPHGGVTVGLSQESKQTTPWAVEIRSYLSGPALNTALLPCDFRPSRLRLACGFMACLRV